MKQLLVMLAGIFFLFLFYNFSVQVKNERFKQINFDTTVRLQDNIPARFEEPIEDLGFFISPVPSLIWIAVLTLFALISIPKKKIYPAALLLPFFFGLMIGAEIIGKSRVESPAPPFFMLKNPTTLFPKYHVQEEYSYPSGHAARSLFFAGIVSWLLRRSGNKKIWLLGTFGLAGVVLVISLGKVYLGHHWLSDILGGWLIALACLSFASIGFLFSFSYKRH